MAPRFLLCLLLPALLTALPAGAQQLPPEKPEAVVGEQGSVAPAQSMRLFDELIAAPVRQARRTLPQAQKRYQTGLQPGETFYLTTRVVDADGKFEQAVVQVKQWEGAYVQGTIANTLQTVQGYITGQQLEFTTSAVLDWTLVHANGSEEGNFVGKFLAIQDRLDALEQ